MEGKKRRKISKSQQKPKAYSRNAGSELALEDVVQRVATVLACWNNTVFGGYTMRACHCGVPCNAINTKALIKKPSNKTSAFFARLGDEAESRVSGGGIKNVTGHFT